MATSALQSLSFGAADSKKSERGYAGIGLLALLGLGAGAAIWASRRGGAAPPPQAVQPAYGAYAYTIGSNPDDVNGLTAILRRELGDESLAMWVYDLNRDVLPTNINLIERGMVIQIPTRRSVGAAPAAALADFRHRFDLLKALFVRECTPASVRGGRGSKNCGSKREGILPIAPDDPILAPTVTPDRQAARVAAAAGDNSSGRPVSSTFSFENRLATINGLTPRLAELGYGGGGISARVLALTTPDAGVSRISA